MCTESLRDWAEPLWNQFVRQVPEFGLSGGVVDSHCSLYGEETHYCAALFPLSKFQGLKHFLLFTHFLGCHEVNLLAGYKVDFEVGPLEEALNEMAGLPGERISAEELLRRLRERGYPLDSVVSWVSQQGLEETLACEFGDWASYVARSREGYISICTW